MQLIIVYIKNLEESTDEILELILKNFNPFLYDQHTKINRRNHSEIRQPFVLD